MDEPSEHNPILLAQLFLHTSPNGYQANKYHQANKMVSTTMYCSFPVFLQYLIKHVGSLMLFSLFIKEIEIEASQYLACLLVLMLETVKKG